MSENPQPMKLSLLQRKLYARWVRERMKDAEATFAAQMKVWHILLERIEHNKFGE